MNGRSPTSPRAPVPVPVVAVGGIAVAGGALLMVQRANPPEAGRWTVPGGRLEPGETVKAAVARELLEETGLEVRCGTLVGWAERTGADYHFVILDFAVEITGVPIPTAGGDAAAVAWVPLAEVGTLSLVEGLRGFLVEHGVLV